MIRKSDLKILGDIALLLKHIEPPSKKDKREYGPSCV